LFASFHEKVEFFFDITIWSTKFLKTGTSTIVVFVGTKSSGAFNGEEPQKAELNDGYNSRDDPKVSPGRDTAHVQTTDLSDEDSEVKEEFEETSVSSSCLFGGDFTDIDGTANERIGGKREKMKKTN
jgi:hypothetical protein